MIMHRVRTHAAALVVTLASLGAASGCAALTWPPGRDAPKAPTAPQLPTALAFDVGGKAVTGATLTDEVRATFKLGMPAAAVYNARAPKPCPAGDHQLLWQARASERAPWVTLHQGQSSETANQIIVLGGQWSLESPWPARLLAAVAVTGLTDRYHVRVAMMCGDKDTQGLSLAEGTLTVTATPDEVAGYAEAHLELPPNRGDEATGAVIRAAAAKAFDQGEVLWVRVLEPTWTVMRSPSGVPLERIVQILVAMRSGEHCFLIGARAVQQAGVKDFVADVTFGGGARIHGKQRVVCEALPAK